MQKLILVNVRIDYDAWVAVGNLAHDMEISKARRDLNWEKQFKLALYPEEAKAVRASRMPEHEDSCTMCGSFCAAKGAAKLFSEDLQLSGKA